MLQFEYEKLPIIEQANSYSQTEDGSIFICSKEGFNEPIYKWKDTYLKFTKDIPKNIKELKNTVYYGTLGTSEAKKLLRFLNSLNKYGFTDLTVYNAALGVWECFHDTFIE